MSFGSGTVFSVQTDGTGFKNLFSFNNTDAYLPVGGLTLVGSTLYGVTNLWWRQRCGHYLQRQHGRHRLPNLFSFNGQYPAGDLTLVGSTLYGMTQGGGENGDGIVFSLTIPEPSTIALLAAAAIGLLGWARGADCLRYHERMVILYPSAVPRNEEAFVP